MHFGNLIDPNAPEFERCIYESKFVRGRVSCCDDLLLLLRPLLRLVLAQPTPLPLGTAMEVDGMEAAIMAAIMAAGMGAATVVATTAAVGGGVLARDCSPEH